MEARNSASTISTISGASKKLYDISVRSTHLPEGPYGNGPPTRFQSTREINGAYVRSKISLAPAGARV